MFSHGAVFLPFEMVSFAESKWLFDWSVSVVRVRCNTGAVVTIPRQRSSQSLLSHSQDNGTEMSLASLRTSTRSKSPGVAGSCGRVIPGEHRGNHVIAVADSRLSHCYFCDLG